MNYLSLFSGIEAASVAWKPLGWQCVGVAEIDPFPCAVLSHHYPDVPNLGSVTDITDERIAALGRIDLIVGGFPCQDLSVAGKRAGLRNDDGTVTRSGLFFDAMRIVRWAREHCGLRWLLIENVPGLYSSNRGRDFAAVVGEMVGAEFDVPRDGWRNAGVAAGPDGLCEWATLDAQFFNVAQRRVRVFALADFGDWANRPPILLERESLRGDSAPSREAGKDVAPTIAARTRGGGGLGTDFDCDGRLSAGVAHSLRAEGFDASEDGTGRGTPLVPVAFAENSRAEVRLEGGDGQRVGAISTGGGKPGQGVPMVAFMADDYKDGGYEECDTARPLTTSADRTRAAPVIAFSGKDYGADAGEVAPTPRGMGHDSSHANGGGQVAAAFESRFARNGRGAPSDVVPPLKAQSGETGKGDGAPLLATAMQVRRLTPVECSRLQGFPDDYLLQVPWRGKTPPPDGPMYKALGNSMAVPVMRWIGQQIAAAASSRIAA